MRCSCGRVYTVGVNTRSIYEAKCLRRGGRLTVFIFPDILADVEVAPREM